MVHNQGKAFKAPEKVCDGGLEVCTFFRQIVSVNRSAALLTKPEGGML